MRNEDVSQCSGNILSNSSKNSKHGAVITETTSVDPVTYPTLWIYYPHSSAGRDTTAQALSWMFYLIHRDQSDKNIARKLREEIDEVIGDAEPTYETTKKMTYAEAWYVVALILCPHSRSRRVFLYCDSMLLYMCFLDQCSYSADLIV
jgi:phosphoribosyl-ATP pyrophosphohydrolase